MRNYQYVPQFQVRSDVRSGEGGGYVDGVWYPDMSGYCGGSTTTTPPPTTTTPPPSSTTSGGGYVGGVWYPDMSGTCG
jgi:hypothetical protein